MYTEIVKNITFSADPDVIDKARLRARQNRTTLNIVFRQWLERYAGETSAVGEYASVMTKLRHVKAGGKFSRDDLNARG